MRRLLQIATVQSCVIKDFHLHAWLLSFDLSVISAKLVIILKDNIIFAKYLEIMLGNNITFLHTHIC